MRILSGSNLLILFRVAFFVFRKPVGTTVEVQAFVSLLCSQQWQHLFVPQRKNNYITLLLICFV